MQMGLGIVGLGLGTNGLSLGCWGCVWDLRDRSPACGWCLTVRGGREGVKCSVELSTDYRTALHLTLVPCCPSRVFLCCLVPTVLGNARSRAP